MTVLRILFVVLCVILPLTAFGAQHEVVKKAKTIDELAQMYDSSACKECHLEIYEQWEKSLHAHAMYGPLNTGRTAATFKTTIENGLKEWPYSGVKTPDDVQIRHLQLCTKCHLPQIVDAEESVAQEIVKNVYAFANEGDEKAAAQLKKLNIGCTICHGRNSIIHKWTFGYPEKNVVYGSKDGEHPAPGYPTMKKSPYMKEAILCGQCHGLGPNLELENPSQCGTLYGFYLWSYRAEGGDQSCQECHMVKSKLGHNMQSYRAPEMYKDAIDFKVDAYGYIWRDVVTTTPMGLVNVEMTNRAGHAVPDG
jgi:Cytochrome c554 and c-prime